MRTVIHETPGAIDLKAFTTFGVNAKPNALNPIGYFGTGLKYAIAVLLREGCRVTVWVGGEAHVFYSEKIKFRDKEFLQLRMKRQRGVTARWMSQELPFTTELGKNWKLWMALRELHSNTLDENGRTYALAEGLVFAPSDPSRTVIEVEGDAYADCFDTMSEIFLPPRPAGDTSEVRVRWKPDTRSGYFRGLRAIELRRPSLHEWDVYDYMSLTEDRTIQHPFMFEYNVTKFVMASTDEALITRCLQASAETYEGTLDWAINDHPATELFIDLARRYGNKSVVVWLDKNDPERKRAAQESDWRRQLADLLGDDQASLEAIGSMARQNRYPLKALLEVDLNAHPAPRESEVTQQAEDDIPF